MVKRLFAALFGALVLIGLPAVAHADQTFSVPADLSSPAGLAWDAGRSVYWATNATGTSLYALDRTGAPLGTVRYSTPGTAPASIEGLSYAGRAVFVGDIGGDRDRVNVLRIRTLTYGSTDATAYTLRYPDGSHDAKAMAVSPKGNVYIVTSGPGAAIYRASDPTASQNRSLVRVASAPEDITDAVFNADGGRLILRGAEQVSVLDAYSWKTVASAYTLPQQQADTVALTPANSLLLLSRDQTTPVLTMSVPTRIDTVRPTPSASPSPSASLSPAASPGASASPSVAASAQPQAPPTASEVHLEGTLTALGIAAGIAVLAGVVVAVKR